MDTHFPLLDPTSPENRHQHPESLELSLNPTSWDCDMTHRQSNVEIDKFIDHFIFIHGMKKYLESDIEDLCERFFQHAIDFEVTAPDMDQNRRNPGKSS